MRSKEEGGTRSDRENITVLEVVRKHVIIVVVVLAIVVVVVIVIATVIAIICVRLA